MHMQTDMAGKSRKSQYGEMCSFGGQSVGCLVGESWSQSKGPTLIPKPRSMAVNKAWNMRTVPLTMLRVEISMMLMVSERPCRREEWLLAKNDGAHNEMLTGIPEGVLLEHSK